ncbi:hypothetical protein [Segatella copri]|uniref:hypothetical protein n=1 Tax=Segatella copri TaxID=165179 RepID=UPI00294B0066|nr:hypothetical protein [Segatella copri]WOG32432.1 hypothetical protein RJT04_02080 [Segatella copri]
MKKFRFFSFASAMLLASAAGMVSCSSDSIEPTGGSGATGQVVKTQFAINIPYGGNSSTNQAKKVTRMTDEMTQQSGKPFRGISDIVLLTFSDDPETAGTINADKPISIGTDGNAYSKDPYRRLYRDIEIPVGTNHMLFYGRASRTTENNFQAGKITDKGDKKTEKTLANIFHELKAISSEANFATDEDAKAIIKALNDIAQVKVTDDDNVEYSWATIGNATTLPTWLTAHEKEFLKTRYDEFIKLKAGSKKSVVAFINNLKAALVGEISGTTIPDEKKLTKEIYDKCVAAITAIESIDFPGKFNLPDGAASLSWIAGESKFAYNAPENVTIGSGNYINYQNICYPAELSYFVNTTTMVSDKDMSNLSEFPAYNDWTNPTGANWTGKNFEESAVTNTTKTVGLKDPVQYSVAVLKSTVRCDAATLEDNAKQMGGSDTDQKISVPTDGFKVTGILIGGQPASVDWQYEPTSSETFANTIYDKEMNGSMYAKHEASASNANYTLVFDNKKSDAQSPVYVTLELENNSDKNFYGKDGIILKGAKFYLVGQLNPNKTGLINPNSVNRVFVQDYVTTANFNIKDLRSAYNCIPDLRTSGINVGLAVDLDWKSGITFDVDI